MTDLPTHNRKVLLRRRPGAVIKPADTEVVDAAVPGPAASEALVRMELIAMDPVTRVIINEDIGLVPPIALGEPLRSFGGGVVVQSRSDAFPVGAKVTGFLEWAEWQVVTEGPRVHVLPEGVDVEAGLNIYGHTAMAAYFGLLDVGKLKSDDLVIVSGAGGAVGSVAGQIARIVGARTVGIVRGETKRRWVAEVLGYDDGVDYSAADFADRLRSIVGANARDILFFDNVGGELLEAVLPLIGTRGRVVSCGASAQYTSTKPLAAPSNPANVPLLRYNAMDYADRFGAAAAQMLEWQRAGSLSFPQKIVEGLEQAPDALNMLFDGRSRGRTLVRIV